jgi:rhodanese-related sulfurtransferase
LYRHDNIQLEQFAPRETVFEDRIDDLDKDKTYVIYCRSGVRSAGALDVMEQLGFKEVYNILEGILRWTDAGFPVVQ